MGLLFLFVRAWREARDADYDHGFIATGFAGDEDGDSSMQSNGVGHAHGRVGVDADDEESLPPLEKARRRRSMLPAR